jgi:hypothetical protein
LEYVLPVVNRRDAAIRIFHIAEYATRTGGALFAASLNCESSAALFEAFVMAATSASENVENALLIRSDS